MYSAKQINGRRLYDLAREGITVERKPVRVKIGALRIESVSLPEVTFTVDCSKGTYIRTLCADIGDRLGCGGAMAHLTRIRVGGFLIEDAVTIGKIEELAGKGDIEDRIIPVEEMFLDHLRVRTQPSCDRKLLNGNRLEPEEMGLPARGAGELLRVCTSDGEFIAVYRRDEQTGSYRPYRMLTDL
jgi:tRNA pseudouridine55 synthase